jgi:4-amino-4-deoxy-L-arabinose transferase-like glycosyltransferase
MKCSKEVQSVRPPASVIGLVCVHLVLVAWISVRNSPNPDERSHLASGVAIWQFGRFDLYRVNPPLVRLIASAPVACLDRDTDWNTYIEYHQDVSSRSEWNAGLEFLQSNRDRAWWYYPVSRLACLPFSALGALICYRWATELYGRRSGFVAVILWCFSPNLIAWSGTICPDAPAAALGVAAGYAYWKWLTTPSWSVAFAVGLLLGLTELTKMTWLVLFILWPVMWLIRRYARLTNPTPRKTTPSLIQVFYILILGILIINLGYCCDGSGTCLGDYTFTCRTLAGSESVTDGNHGGNRFTNTLIGRVPIPLPKEYVQGIDIQKVDFEHGLPSYLYGKWSDRGWWYYYFVCALFKVPLGTWILFFAAAYLTVRRTRAIEPELQRKGKLQTQHRARWFDEIVLLLPAITVVIFVSSQTGFSRHFRYVLPALPFLFIWISKIASDSFWTPRLGRIVSFALIWSVTSTISVYPHCMSYFNELSGGPRNGHNYLLSSSMDWEQDVWYLRDWTRSHLEGTPLRVAPLTRGFDFLHGLKEMLPMDSDPQDPNVTSVDETNTSIDDFKSGWYAFSVTRLHEPKYRDFLVLEPAAYIGYSFRLFWLDDEHRHEKR